MKLGELDSIDGKILGMLQANCKMPWGKIAEQVGLSAPSVIERVRKMEERGIIRGYHALLDGRSLGLDVTAFIGVIVERHESLERLEKQIEALANVLECHHVTGEYTLLLKVKTRDTASLETLIQRIRKVPGVSRTETMVVLSTHTERVQLHLEESPFLDPKRSRRTERNFAEAREAR
ncbi:MAG: AsnC family transcriptional regulator [Candidatus Binatia bacterium]|nr:MAG: AsnC family transcriptional regulator [Candidatus Binatia bacterium]